MLRLLIRWTALSCALIVAGIAVAMLTGVYVDYEQRHWTPPARWVQFVAFTLLLVFSTIGSFRHRPRTLTFWLVLNTLVLLHVVIYAFVLTSVGEWRLVWFVPLMGAEYAVFALVLDFATERLDRKA